MHTRLRKEAMNESALIRVIRFIRDPIPDFIIGYADQADFADFRE